MVSNNVCIETMFRSSPRTGMPALQFGMHFIRADDSLSLPNNTHSRTM